MSLVTKNVPILFDASHPRKVGDFGQIDKENGQFVREGNIYRDEPLASIAKDYPPVVYDPIPEFRIDSGFAPRVHTPP
jgi:hypothetical protein